MIRIRRLVFFLFGLIAVQLNAQPLYHVNTQYPVHDLKPFLEFTVDEDQSLTPDQVLKDTTLAFSIQDKATPHLRIASIYWGRISILTSEELQNWTLNFEDKLNGLPAWTRSNGEVDVYAFYKDDLIFHKKSGVEYPANERDVQDKWILNRVLLDDLPINKRIDLAIRIKGNSLGFPPYFNLTLRHPGQAYYHELFAFHESFKVFMLGITFIILLYHLLQFIYLRQRVFLWFSIWVFFCCLTMAMSTGLIIGDFSKFRFPIWQFIANGVLYSFWFFGRSFINSKDKFPTLDKIILGLSLAMLAEIILTTCYLVFFEPQPFLTNVGIHYMMILIFSGIGAIVAMILILKKDLFARYFGFGAMIVSLAFFIGSLRNMLIISVPFDPFTWGMFLQIVIYSFGIAYRQRTLLLKSQEEKLKAQHNYAEMLRIKDLDEVKTLFYTNISHEFRTPLSLISGPLSQAKKTAKPDSDQINISTNTFEIIERNTHRLQHLIDQLLELSKIESGKVHLNLTQGDLIKFIKSIVFSFESMSESKAISFNSSFPEEPESAFYDKDKLEKIISNLLSNAFKYTPTGGIITITVEIIDSHYILEISDTGKGMNKDEVLQIFERFYRVEGSEEKGSGIGLALTKEMVDLQNGQISVNSRKGEGTSFKVRIPYSLQQLPEHISIVSKNERKESEPIHNQNNVISVSNGDVEHQQPSILATESKPVILLVEDNADLRHFISDILKDNYNIILAEDGLKGERLAFEHIPDVVLSDIMMPGKDGYQLCHALKTNAKTSHIPIIMLTAKAGHENKMEGLAIGADDYLTKPFHAEELLLRIKNLIHTRKKIWEHFDALDLTVVKGLNVTSIEDQFLQSVIKVIRQNLDNENLSVEDLAKEVGFSRAQLHRKLKALCNKSANQMIIEIRLNEAKQMLERKAGTVSEIAYSVGYSNMSYFTKSFKTKFGVLPSKV